jgi:hypothetical protein
MNYDYLHAILLPYAFIARAITFYCLYVNMYPVHSRYLPLCAYSCFLSLDLPLWRRGSRGVPVNRAPAGGGKTGVRAAN